MPDYESKTRLSDGADGFLLDVVGFRDLLSNPPAAPPDAAYSQVYMRNGVFYLRTAGGDERALSFNEIVNIYAADLNTAGSFFGASPVAGLITRVQAVNYVANTTTATVLTLEINGSAVTIPTWQFGATDAAGTVVGVVPTAENVLEQGDTIEVISDGGGTPTMPGNIIVTIERTG